MTCFNNTLYNLIIQTKKRFYDKRKTTRGWSFIFKIILQLQVS